MVDFCSIMLWSVPKKNFFFHLLSMRMVKLSWIVQKIIIITDYFVKVKSAYKPCGPSGQHSSNEYSTPSWMGCQSITGFLSPLNLLLPLCTPGQRGAVRLVSALGHNVQHNIWFGTGPTYRVPWDHRISTHLVNLEAHPVSHRKTVTTIISTLSHLCH